MQPTNIENKFINPMIYNRKIKHKIKTEHLLRINGYALIKKYERENLILFIKKTLVLNKHKINTSKTEKIANAF